MGFRTGYRHFQCQIAPEDEVIGSKQVLPVGCRFSFTFEITNWKNVKPGCPKEDSWKLILITLNISDNLERVLKWI